MPVGAALISADQILLSPAYDYIIDITDLEFQTKNQTIRHHCQIVCGKRRAEGFPHIDDFDKATLYANIRSGSRCSSARSASRSPISVLRTSQQPRERVRYNIIIIRRWRRNESFLLPTQQERENKTLKKYRSKDTARERKKGSCDG